MITRLDSCIGFLLTRHWFVATVLVFSSVGLASLPATAQDQPTTEGPRLLRVIYFIPTDRTPEPDHVARLDRVMTEVQGFYREGMEQNGHGPLTFELERDREGALVVHEVRANGPMTDYGRDASAKVRGEVRAALAKNGLNIDGETVIIFQLLLAWQGERAIEVGPYVGGGRARGGTAWVYDDAKLDPRLLASKEPGGYYVSGPCSLGEFNTHYIGGMAHELGHALGLPHERERDRERHRRGSSLMGGGNHTYGQEQRGAGPGAFLTAAAALPLSLHPLFNRQGLPPVDMSCRLTELEPTAEKGALTLAGRLEGGPPAVGMVAYNDPQDVPADYDALGWTSPIDAEGRFRLLIEDLQPGDYELRLASYVESGDARSFAFRYRVGPDNQPDVAPFVEALLLPEALAAFRQGDKQGLAAILAQSSARHPQNAALARKLKHLNQLLSPATPVELADTPAKVKSVNVADLEMEEMSVGWGGPLRNQVLGEGDASCLLEVGGEFSESGLYAHAPARHALRLKGEWKTLNTQYGLQDGHNGSVVFVVKGDGRELFRSEAVRDHEVRRKSVRVAGVDSLELLVEDAGDGGNSDWGVWLAPRLSR